MGHSVMEAINRQLAHYPYHIGQIVCIGKMACETPWTSLSIPKGNSSAYNADKFSQPKRTEHFTNEFLSPKKEEWVWIWGMKMYGLNNSMVEVKTQECRPIPESDTYQSKRL